MVDFSTDSEGTRKLLLLCPDSRQLIEIVPERRGSRVTISESVGGLMRAFVRSPPTLKPSFELYCTGLQREAKRRARG